MLKNWGLIILLFFNFTSVAQHKESDFEIAINLLKQKDNFTEYIYTHLDEFVKKSSIENLVIFDNLISNLWRSPKNKNESIAQLYLHINYAFYLKQFGFIDQSIIEYEKAYRVYINGKIKNYDIIEYCLKPLANNYTRLGDVDRAEDILKITINKAQKENNIHQIIAGYSNLSIVYRTKGEYKKAIKYLNLGLDLSNEKQVKSKIYSDVAINFLYLNEFQKAAKNSLLSNKLNIQNEISIFTRNAITLGNCFVEKKEFQKALNEFQKALKTAKIVFGKNDREVAKIYNQIAKVYIEEKQFEKALNSYQISLQTLLPKYNPETIFENPSITYFYPENTLKESFDGRAKVFTQINKYKNALKNYELAFKVEAELRSSFLTQNSKLIQQQENRDRSENCIELCYKLYQQTSNSDWIERAFQFAEQSKSVVLFEAKDEAYLRQSIKNDSLFILESNLFFKQAQLNKSIVIEELKEDKASIKLLANLIEDRNEIDNKIQLLKQQINLKYPHLKVKTDSLITFKNIEDKLLKNDELLIEFFYGNKNIYVFSISKGHLAKLNRIVIDKNLEEQVSEFLDLFSDSRGTALQNNVPKYTLLGYQLYKKLFNIELKDKVIIIPDGLFSFIPFDALITENTLLRNFEKLPYLLKKSNISYGYSATILMREKEVVSNRKNNFIGFFPVFENNYRNLSELTYTLQEFKSIKNTIKGEFHINSDASKKAFNKLAKNYSIVHLSTHASAGNYYEPAAIEFYNETLYLPEIYGYNFQTDLLVLSACETGLGTLRKGEGAMSLARGFSYAGVKNLLVSLWKVNDKSTEELMAVFYKNLNNNNNKSEALHKAKLAYIRNETITSSKKSPYYWASFVYFGEVNLLEKNNFRLTWVYIIGLALVVGYFLFKKGKFGINK